MFGMLLMALEDLQAGLQQALELGAARGRDQLRRDQVESPDSPRKSPRRVNALT
jgi:hypothetical protein